MSTESAPRRLWRAAETLHAVTYFADESIAAARDVGYRGFWMGYFAFRAAPLGPVGPGPVSALFNNFHPDLVERALPDAWGFSPPAVALESRRASAAAALQRVGVAAPNRHVIEDMFSAVGGVAANGRAMFAANRQVPVVGDGLPDLWQWCTTVREHRGDGHVGVLMAHKLDGVESTVLLAAEKGIDIGVFERSRGWDQQQVSEAKHRLVERGLLEVGKQWDHGDHSAGNVSLSPAGVALRHTVEEATDDLARVVINQLGGRYEHVVSMLERAAAKVRASGVIPFPNPMGLDSGPGAPASA